MMSSFFNVIFFQVFSYCSRNQRQYTESLLLVKVLQYPLTLKDISHGMQSKYQGLLISELLFPGVPWELSLQIMSFMGILGGVRVCSG